jgi:hypothetical protein
VGVLERQRAVQLYRGQIPSPGRPTVAWRQDRVRFWAAIAAGAMTEDAATEAGVSSPVGFRWFRHAGGVNPQLSEAVSGRYLSSDERENIALWRAQALECARSPGGWAGRRRPFRVSCAATPRHARIGSTEPGRSVLRNHYPPSDPARHVHLGQGPHRRHRNLHRRLERPLPTLRVDQDRRRNPHQS